MRVYRPLLWTKRASEPCLVQATSRRSRGSAGYYRLPTKIKRLEKIFYEGKVYEYKNKNLKMFMHGEEEI